MQKLSDFIAGHIGDDPARLALNRDRFPGVDVALAAETLLSREKIRRKLPDWYAERGLVLPSSLSAEQCSSGETAAYKAALVKRLCGESSGGGCVPLRIADLTGGLGADAAAFSKVASEVLYNEMNPLLCEAARFNFGLLGIANCRFSNCRVEPGNVAGILDGFQPSVIFLDPARRSAAGRKLFLPEDCSPDVTVLKDELLALAPTVLVKLSPMADITMLLHRLGNSCSEMHIVGTATECKELLAVMRRGFSGECSIITGGFSFLMSEERTAVPVLAESLPERGDWLLEPGKSMMKASPFNVLSSRYALEMMGRSTHVFLEHPAVADGQAWAGSRSAGFPSECFRRYEVIECEALNSRSIRAFGRRYPRAEAVARNVHVSSEDFVRRLGCSQGSEYRIFALRHDASGSDLIVACRASGQ